MRTGIWILLLAQFVFAQSMMVEIEELPTQNTKKTTAKSSPQVLMVDDFEDGDLERFREWWNFGKVVPSIVENEPELGVFIQQKSMEINASSTNWYAGGIGTYLNADVSEFSVLKLVMYSPHINAGTIRVELYDDDNNNKVVDVDESTGLPSNDDVFIYDLNVAWQGWRVVTIPLAEFVDNNPTVGDNRWNPTKRYGSSGLTQMQLVIMSSKFKSETIQLKIDTIKFN